MVKLSLAQIKQQLGTNAKRDGFHTFFLKSLSTTMLVCFKDPAAKVERRLIMQRIIGGEKKVRMILEAGDRVQLVNDSPHNGVTLATSSFVDVEEYIYDGKRFFNTTPSQEPLQWQPISLSTPHGFCTQTYVDVQRAILNDALLNYVEINNIGFTRISFVANEYFKNHAGLAFGLVFEPKGYRVTVLSPRDDMDAYDAVVHVKLSTAATITVQAHDAVSISKTWNLMRKKLLDSNCVIDHSSENLLMIIYGDPSKLDVEIVE